MHTGDLRGAKAELDQALKLNPDSYLTNANVLAFYQRTRDPRLQAQERKMAELESKRSEKQELMLRTIQASPVIVATPGDGQRRQ
jgi:Tfp pilus assembly protein PilF